jgi:NOL1/NOP2/fmu family ribosome biogenesis protein
VELDLEREKGRRGRSTGTNIDGERVVKVVNDDAILMDVCIFFALYAYKVAAQRRRAKGSRLGIRLSMSHRSSISMTTGIYFLLGSYNSGWTRMV